MPLTLFRYPARMIGLGTLAIAALAAVGWDAIRPGKRWADLLLVLAVTGDLLIHAQPLLRTAPLVTTIPYARSVGGDSLFLRLGPFDGNRHSWISGYLNLYERRFDAYTAAPVVAQDYQRFYAGLLTGRSWFLLDSASIGHVLTARKLGRPFKLTAETATVRCYAYRPAATIATVWRYATVSPSRGMALDSLLGNVSAWPVSGLPAPILSFDNRPYAAASTLTTSRATVTMETSVPALVVLAQRDARGWRVEVDGKPAEKLQAGGLFRAVSVGAGRHEIVWTYVPVPFFFGAVLTLVTLVTGLLRIFVKQRTTTNF